MTIKDLGRKAVLATVLAGSLAGLGAGVATAATSDTFLTAREDGPYHAGCTYTGDVRWDRGADKLTGNVFVQNHMVFEACRKAAIVTYVNAEGWEFSKTYEIPTMAGTGDWFGGPKSINQPIDDQPVTGSRAAGVDHIRLQIVNR